MLDRAALRADIAAIRQRGPLVLSVTNNVVTNVTANALLALGASPAMSHAAPDAAVCLGCGACLSACEREAIGLVPRPHPTRPPRSKAATANSLFSAAPCSEAPAAGRGAGRR